ILAGGLAAVMAGATMGVGAFGLGLSDFPGGLGFVSATGADFVIVYGDTAAAADIGSAIDVSARLGGEVVRKSEPQGTGSGAVVLDPTGGKAVATTNTKVFLDDDIGKNGLRNTMTLDDLPTLLAKGVLVDSDVSITSNYNQFIYLTPGDTTSAAYDLQYDQHGTTSIDPEYNFGEFPTTPTNTDYWYRTKVVFDKGVNSTAAGEKVKFFGKDFSIHSDTVFSGSTPKLVLSGGSDTVLLVGGESKLVTLGGTSYEVTYVASSDADTGIVKVGTDQKSIDQGKSAKVGGVDVYMDRVFDVSSTDTKLDSAQLLLGAQKLVLQDGSKVKIGDNEDNVEGTYVNLTVSVTSSTNRLDAFAVHIGGKSSSEDFLKEGSAYEDPVWKTFKIDFSGVTPAKTDTLRSVTTIKPSGDNLLQVEYTDSNLAQKTLTWAYKGASTAGNFTLADSNGKNIAAKENETLRQDEFFIGDSGGYSHLYKISSITVTAAGGAASDNVIIQDIFSGVSTTINLAADGIDTKVIDGQSYYFGANTSAVEVTWGNSAAAVQGARNNTDGDFLTLFPGIKGSKGEWLHFYDSGYNFSVSNGTRVQLPTGAINFTLFNNSAPSYYANITATPKEDGTASALTGTVQLNLTDANPTTLFTLGRTTTGGLIYNITLRDNASLASSGQATINIRIVGDTGTVGVTAPGLLLVEEKDDSSNQYSVFVSASTETSGSNNVAIPTAPTFTASEDTTTGSDSTKNHYVDLYGTYAVRTTSGQDTITLYYPDTQVAANVAVVSTLAS
ncbi:MAG: hypothetical protein HZC29_04695, partial [Thaumarchaeota archaeon]|nr:hypothetical protein [Nitrososphaerota archaeon]